MKTFVHNFVASCSTCKNIAATANTWGCLASYFYGLCWGLPRSANKNAILIVVDKLSKFLTLSLHLVLLSFSWFTFINSMACLQLSSLTDKIFTSQLWQALFKLAGVSLAMSSAYHPQSDGKTKRVTQCLETFLRCFVHACPSNGSIGSTLQSNSIIQAGILSWCHSISSTLWTCTSHFWYWSFRCLSSGRFGCMAERTRTDVPSYPTTFSLSTGTHEKAGWQTSLWSWIQCGWYGIPEAAAICANIYCSSS